MFVKINNEKITITNNMVEEALTTKQYKGISIGEPVVNTELYNRIAVIEMINNGTDMSCYEATYGTKADFDNNISYLNSLVEQGILSKKIKAHKSIIPTTFDNWVRNVVCVKEDIDGYTFNLKDNSQLSVKLNGDIYKIKDGKSQYSNRKNCDRSITTVFSDTKTMDVKESNHTAVSGERLVLVAQLLLKDELPLTTRGMQANCMDLSGSKETSKKYGLVPHNFKYVEISDVSANSKHRWMWTRLYEITGKKYVISGYDNCLHYLLRSGSVSDINWYIQLKGIQEVK